MMTVPGSETPTPGDADGRGGRRIGLIAALGATLLGLMGVTALAFVGHDSSRVVATTAGAQHPAVPTTRLPGTTTTANAVSTTAVTASATEQWPSPTTTPPTSRPPATAPPTTKLPTTTAPKTSTTVSMAARLHIGPSVARFPSLPPPYWPMPIVSVTVTNTGGVTIRSIVVHPVGVYSIPSSTCSALSPGQSCVAKVQFCPSSPGQYLNTLLVTGQSETTGTFLQTSIALDGVAT